MAAPVVPIETVRPHPEALIPIIAINRVKDLKQRGGSIHPMIFNDHQSSPKSGAVLGQEHSDVIQFFSRFEVYQMTSPAFAESSGITLSSTLVAFLHDLVTGIAKRVPVVGTTCVEKN